MDQEKFKLVPYLNTDAIKKVIIWQHYYVVKQDESVFYSDTSDVQWKSLPVAALDFAVDRESSKLYVVTEKMQIVLFDDLNNFHQLGKKSLLSRPVDMQVVNHALFVLCPPQDVYRIDADNFTCRRPFAFCAYCEDHSNRYITQQKAITIAQRRHLVDRFFRSERQGWSRPSAVLDTASKVWIMDKAKLTFRQWGKTTRHGKSDHCHQCRDINGCHVIKTQTIKLDATSGRVLSRTRTKSVEGNYE
jgi:hypothetical protein